MESELIMRNYQCYKRNIINTQTIENNEEK